MQEQALSIIHKLPSYIQSLIFEKFMPQGYDALQPEAYADISNLLIVDKYIHNLINDPDLLWRPQLRRILDALGFEKLEVTAALQFNKSQPAITPKQLAFSIIEFDYPATAKKIVKDDDKNL
jgi:hypothetical protein